MSFLSLSFKIFDIWILILCLVYLSASEEPNIKFWVTQRYYDILHVQCFNSSKTDYKGDLIISKDNTVIVTIKVNTGTSGQQINGPLYDRQRMRVSHVPDPNGPKYILHIEKPGCDEKNKEFECSWTPGENHTTMVKLNLKPSSPQMENPNGMQLKDGHTHKFFCISYDGDDGPQINLHWEVTRRGKVEIYSENSQFVKTLSIQDREGGGCRNRMNSTLTLTVAGEDIGMEIRCIFQSKNPKLKRKVDSKCTNFTNQFCGVLGKFEILCYLEGTWEVNYCMERNIDVRIFVMVVFVAVLFLYGVLAVERRKARAIENRAGLRRQKLGLAIEEPTVAEDRPEEEKQHSVPPAEVFGEKEESIPISHASGKSEAPSKHGSSVDRHSDGSENYKSFFVNQ